MKTPVPINSTGKCLYKKPAISRLAAIYWALFIPMGLIFAIFLSSLLRTDGSTPGFAFIGRIPSELQSGLHVPMFFGLTLILLVLLQRFEKRRRNQILFAFVLANYVGILNEGLQMLIPGRNASLGDVGLNLAGTLLGLVFYFGIRRWKSVNRGNSDSGGWRSAFGGWRSAALEVGGEAEGRGTQGEEMKSRRFEVRKLGKGEKQREARGDGRGAKDVGRWRSAALEVGGRNRGTRGEG